MGNTHIDHNYCVFFISIRILFNLCSVQLLWLFLLCFMLFYFSIMFESCSVSSSCCYIVVANRRCHNPVTTGIGPYSSLISYQIVYPKSTIVIVFNTLLHSFMIKMMIYIFSLLVFSNGFGELWAISMALV